MKVWKLSMKLFYHFLTRFFYVFITAAEKVPFGKEIPYEPCTLPISVSPWLLFLALRLHAAVLSVSCLVRFSFPFDPSSFLFPTDIMNNRQH